MTAAVVRFLLGWLALCAAVTVAYVLEAKRRRTFGMRSLMSDWTAVLDEPFGRPLNDVDPGLQPEVDADQRRGSCRRSTPAS